MRIQQGKWDASAPIINADAFVPSKGPLTKVTIGSPDGVVDTLEKYSTQPLTVPIPPASPVATSRRVGNFQSRRKLTSEERFALSSGARSTSVGGTTLQFNQSPKVHMHNQGGPGHPIGSNKRGDSSKTPLSQQRRGSAAYRSSSVAPLEMSANRWVPTSSVHKTQPDVDTPEMVDRKVKALLNKLTMKRFDSISEQIIQWANKSVNEKDGRTLIQVIRLLFEKATDVAAWAEMYARLCRKMMEQISPDVQDDGIKNTGGKPIAGGQLFRKYLLDCCQEDFERGWFAKEAAAQKAKRQGLGLIKFIGELFKLQMLTERIMHECVKKLLGNVENPKEEEIESLCQLLKTVGQLLDTPKARAHMDVYFTRMKGLRKSTNVSSRIQFMLQDVIELRERKWVSRNAVAVPTTTAAVHEAAAKDRAAAEKEPYNRQASMSRGGSRRGSDRNHEYGPDGWAVAGGPPSRPPPNSKASDLSQFGKISKGALMVMGPSSVFVDAKKDGKRESLSQTSSNSNMSQMLSQNPEPAPEPSAKHSRPTSQKPSVDLGQVSVPGPPVQRKKLQLLPRSKPTAEESTPVPSENELESAPTDMSEADAKKKIDEDMKEFFAVRNLEEADVYFADLPHEHRFRLVDKLVASALERKEADARLVGELFARAESNGLCTLGVFEEGFMPMAEFLDDIAIDAPNAYDNMTIMLKGAGFEKEPERLERIASKLENSNKLNLLAA